MSRSYLVVVADDPEVLAKALDRPAAQDGFAGLGGEGVPDASAPAAAHALKVARSITSPRFK